MVYLNLNKPLFEVCQPIIRPSIWEIKSTFHSTQADRLALTLTLRIFYHCILQKAMPSTQDTGWGGRFYLVN